MYNLRISLIVLFAFCLMFPSVADGENTYRVDGLPEDLHYETGKVYSVGLIASNYSAISNVNISVTNGTLSVTETFEDNIIVLNLSESQEGWTFYWQAPSESFELGEGNALLSINFETSEGESWAYYESVIRPPEVVEHSEPAVPDWALSLAWTGASITVLVTIIGALVLRRDKLSGR